MAYIILVILWVIYYALHTLLASLKIKRNIQGIMGEGYKWYRLCYSLISTFFLLAILLYAASIAKIMVFPKDPRILYVGYLIAGLGTIILVKSFKHFNTAKFIGLSPYNDLEEEKTQLITSGIYKHIRHPTYSGIIGIFIGYFLFDPNLAALIHLFALLAYLPIGIFFEEKKLILIHGKSYLEYKRSVPALFPKIKKAAQ